jgi:predicted RNA-binding protein
MDQQTSTEDLEIFGKVLPGSTKYWIIIASRDHASRGVEGGFVQANHGKKAALQRMRRGDWIVFYCPKETFEGKVPCRRFTGLGEIADDRIYQGEMDAGLHPYRKDVAFSTKMKETPIEPLVPDLSFIRNKKSWGYVFRFGVIEIPREDFLRIAAKMRASSSTS